MKLSFFILLLFFNLIAAGDIVYAEVDAHSEATSAFTSNFKSIKSPTVLSHAVSTAIINSKKSGHLPILVLDMDETSVEKLSSDIVATEFYLKLRDSGAIEASHLVFVLTARPITTNNILNITNSELAKCTPELEAKMRYSISLNGSAYINFPLETRFLYDRGLLVMGGSKLTKCQTLCQTLDISLNEIPNGNNNTYELIIVDNQISWFTEFRNNKKYNPKIIKAHFFHYDRRADHHAVRQSFPITLGLSFPMFIDQDSTNIVTTSYDDDDDVCDGCLALLYGMYKWCGTLFYR